MSPSPRSRPRRSNHKEPQRKVEESPGRFRVLITGICVGIVLLSAVAYAGVRSNGFVAGDDPGYVSENPHVLAGLSGPAVLWRIYGYRTKQLASSHLAFAHARCPTVRSPSGSSSSDQCDSARCQRAPALSASTRMTTDVLAIGPRGRPVRGSPLHVESVAYIAERKRRAEHSVLAPHDLGMAAVLANEDRLVVTRLRSPATPSAHGEADARDGSVHAALARFLADAPRHSSGAPDGGRAPSSREGELPCLPWRVSRRRLQ